MVSKETKNMPQELFMENLDILWMTYMTVGTVLVKNTHSQDIY